MNNQREERKRAHIAHALELEEGPLSPGWEDIRLVHQALLTGDFEAVETKTALFGKELAFPLLINAITGGAQGLEEINASLARVAREAGIGLAVGSQTAALRNKDLRHTYEVVRKYHPAGLVLANVSALIPPQEACEAAEMIAADALQLHLNGAQELLMAEGDRNFSGLAENIREIVERVPVPVLVKEVGFGLSRETAQQLYALGVRHVDTAGAGGTNFAAIELLRRPNQMMEYMRFWGIPSACSLLEVKSLELPLTVIASGGLGNALDVAKALSLGADGAAIAGPFLKTLVQEGEQALLANIHEIKNGLKKIMLLTGVGRVREMNAAPRIITGFTRSWCEQRGIRI
jgi:isopentenyl-diphosphate delta-isomerase